MSYTHLTLQERSGLFCQRGMGKSFHEIAAYFGRSHSTMIREYRRNQNPHEGEEASMKDQLRLSIEIVLGTGKGILFLALKATVILPHL